MKRAAVPAGAAGVDVTFAHPLGRIIGHRGCAAHAPENSLEGITAAASVAADSVELDVRLTADGVPILLHDARLDRTDQGRGPIHLTPFHRLRANGPPPVDAALDLADALGLGVNLEIKGRGSAARRIAGVLRRLLDRRRLRAPLLVSAFDWGALTAFTGRCAPLARVDSPALRDAARRLRATALHLATPAPGTPLPVALYTLNSPQAAAAAAAQGVSALFSDDPGAIRDAFSLAPRAAGG